MTAEKNVEEGVLALESGRWGDARDAFTGALARAETAEALDGMGTALWWLGEARSSAEFHERAYSEFRKRGDGARAAITAMSLSVTYISNFGNEAAAAGWIARADRLLQALDPNPLQGWLWVTRGYLTSDLERAVELLERGLQFAREAGDIDLELCALADLGEKLVMGGKVEEGLALIDEAMAGTLGGEHQRLDTVVFACCDMLVAASSPAISSEPPSGAGSPTGSFKSSGVPFCSRAVALCTAAFWLPRASGLRRRAS